MQHFKVPSFLYLISLYYCYRCLPRQQLGCWVVGCGVVGQVQWYSTICTKPLLKCQCVSAHYESNRWRKMIDLAFSMNEGMSSNVTDLTYRLENEAVTFNVAVNVQNMRLHRKRVALTRKTSQLCPPRNTTEHTPTFPMTA